MQSTSKNTNFPFLKGGGEMGELTRNFDWSKTSLGPVDTWPQSLRITLGNVLNSGFPMFLFWGDDYTCFYNDAFKPSLGVSGKHPALGKKGAEVWSEIWDFVGPLINGVFKTGEPVWFENQLIPFYRNGKIEDIYWTFSYSVVLGDDGSHSGILVTCVETTETVNTAKKFRVYDTIVTATPDLVYVFDLQYRFSYANDALLTMWGKTAQDAIGKGLRENGYEEWHALMHEREIDHVAATKESVRGEVSFPHAVLGSRVYDYILVPVFNKEGEVEAVAGTTRDISDLKQAEWNIRESEARFRTMAEGTNILIAVGDETSNATYFNKAWTDLTGRPMEQLIEFGWVDLVHPGDKDRYINIYLDAFKVRGPFTGEFRVMNPHGEYRWLLADGKPRFNSDKKFLGYISSCVDITEQKLNLLAIEDKEAALQNAVELAELGTWSLDVTARTITLSPQYAEMLGFKELVLNMDQFFSIIAPGDREELKAKFIASVQPGFDGRYDAEYQVINAATGKKQIIHALAQAYVNTDNKVIRLEGTSQDVTAQREVQLALENEVHFRTQELAATVEELQASNEELFSTNEELSESTQKLVRSNEELSQFAYAASHDLQEPLRKIQTFSDRLLRVSDLPTQSHDWAIKISQSAERMRSLIKSLLEFSHLSNPDDTFEVLDLDEIIAEVVKDFEYAIEEKKAILQVDDLPVHRVSRLQMQQLFGNLISNALKFVAPGVTPRIEIHAQLIDVEELKKYIFNPKSFPAYLHITISDNGIGFEKEYAEQIFEIFRRLHVRTDYKGSGIGLALCKRIVTNHKGYIFADSEMGKGSTFHIFLPKEDDQRK